MTILETLELRFQNHPERHGGMSWELAAQRLARRPEALAVLEKMEQTGGEPELVGQDPETGELLFCDCSRESPAGRRGLCYDEASRLKRSKNPPAGSALKQAEEMGVALLTEEQYRWLQTLGEFDLKSSSWVATPPGMLRMGSALFCERRCDMVFTFHNGSDSYYGVRGWRGLLRV